MNKKPEILVIIIEPVRFIEDDTNKESLHINLYKDSDEFNRKEKPYAIIETDILKLRKSLDEINLYGAGFSPKELAELRLWIEKHYRDLREENAKDKISGLTKFIKDIANGLYQECKTAQNNKNELPNNNKGLYCVPIKTFNQVFKKLYASEDNKYDNFDNGALRREMKKQGYIYCNTAECSYFARDNNGHGKKYMAFVEKKCKE